MENRYFLLLDVGGTFVKFIVAHFDGHLIAESEGSVPVDSDGERFGIESAFAEVIRCGSAAVESRGGVVSGVGIAFPGPFDYERGISLMEHKFASLKGVPLMDFFHGLPQIGESCPVVFMHDVTSAVLGELSFGAGRGYDNVALVTLGTGLGFAHSEGGKVQMNEMGEPVRSLYNRPYGDGILEDYASKRGFLRAYAEVRGCENPEGITVADIGGLAKSGDKEALQTFERVATLLAEELAPMLTEFKTECLLFGGQISRSFAFMEPALNRLKDVVPTLKHIYAMENISTSAPLGLLASLRSKLE